MKVSLNLSNTAIKPFQKLQNAVSSNILTNVTKPVMAAGLTSAACLAGQILVNKAVSAKNITDEQLQDYLKKNYYEYSEENEHYIKMKNPNNEEKSLFSSNDGHENQQIMTIYNKGIEKDEVEGFKEFLNLADGKALKYIDSDFDNLMSSYLVLKRNKLYEKHKRLVNENPGYQNLVLDAAIKPLSVYTRNILMDYKMTSYMLINKYLREEDSFYAGDTAKKVSEISNYLDTQSIDAPIKVYRTEGYDVLKKVKLNGQDFDLGEKMLEAKYCSNPEQEQAGKIQELREFILDNEISAHQSAFMSTSLDKDIEHLFAGSNEIVWEFEVPKGTKGVYLEALNSSNILSWENEFLIQKDSDIVIKDLEYNNDTKRWLIKAQIRNK